MNEIYEHFDGNLIIIALLPQSENNKLKCHYNMFLRTQFLEYLCYGSTAIINMLIFQRSEIDFRRRNLTSMDVRF